MPKKPKSDNDNHPITTGNPINLPFQIDPVNDQWVIKGGGGMAVAHVKKPSGEVYSARMRTSGGFSQMTSFDPSSLDISERRELTDNLSRNHTQQEIAGMLGVSQPTVARDLKIIRGEDV